MPTWYTMILYLFILIENGLNVKDGRKFGEKKKFLQLPETGSGIQVLRKGRNQVFPAVQISLY